MIVKHANPCGVALATTVEEAYDKALASDPTSAYGGVIVLNRPVAAELGRELAKQFVEVLFAPGYDEDALEALRAKQGTRILVDSERRRPDRGEKDYKRVLGGLLVQDRDLDVEDREGMQRRVRGAERGAVGRPALRVARVQARDVERDRPREGPADARDRRRPAVTRRCGAARDRKAQAHGHDLRGAALASDAFFPFPDGPQAALDAGVATVIQPGGSKRDDEVVAAVEAAGAVMVFTGRRHFRH